MFWYLGGGDPRGVSALSQSDDSGCKHAALSHGLQLRRASETSHLPELTGEVARENTFVSSEIAEGVIRWLVISLHRYSTGRCNLPSTTVDIPRSRLSLTSAATAETWSQIEPELPILSIVTRSARTRAAKRHSSLRGSPIPQCGTTWSFASASPVSGFGSKTVQNMVVFTRKLHVSSHIF